MMIINLNDTYERLRFVQDTRFTTDHFQGAKPFVSVCITPKLIKPMTMIAAPFIKTART